MDEGVERVQEREPLRAGAVIGGAVLGFVATWFIFAVTVLALYGTYGDTSSRTQDVIAFTGLLGAPVLLGVLALRRSTRRWGAGFVLGLAIGSITSAGICGGFMGLNAL